MKLLFENWRRFINENEEVERSAKNDTLSNNPSIAKKAIYNSILAQDAFKMDAMALSEGTQIAAPNVNFLVSEASKPDQQIVESFVKSLYSGKRSGFLSYYNLNEFMQMNIFLVEGAKAGFAIKQDGDIVSVHNNSDMKGLASLFLETAKKNGGTKLDHFDGFLSGLYRKHGFTDVYEVYQWDEQYKPDTWNFDKVDIFNPNTSVYAKAYEKENEVSLKNIDNLNKSVEVIAEDGFIISVNPSDKIQQYNYGRPDVIFRKL